MASHSSLDPDNVPTHLDRNAGRALDTHLLGPSDSSDAGVDAIGSAGSEEMMSDTLTDVEVTRLDISDADGALGTLGSGDASDRENTGERLSVERESTVHPGSDIGFDRIVRADEAGLGDGLDQAEEAQLGITDEELLDDET